MILSFSGTDGSGKSTLSKLVYEKLLYEGFDVEYQRGFEHFLLTIIIRLIGGKIEPMRDTFMTKNIKKPSYYKLWPYLVWADNVLRLIYLKIFKKNKLIIFDRYILDFLVSWEYFDYGTSKLRKLFLLFPKPEISFIIDAPAKITFGRSRFDHKFPFTFYEIQRQRYLSLANTLNLKIILTTRPVDETLNEILSEIKKNVIPTK